MTGQAAVFLDRDGVINRSRVVDGTPLPPATADDLELIDGVVEACRALKDAGLLLVVVTNQPDVARGTLAPETLAAIHVRLAEELPLDEIVVCPHDDADGCDCRKPRPGMILQAAERHGIDLARSVCVGDRWRDIDAAHAAGVYAVHVDGGHGEPLRQPADASFASLAAAVGHILEMTGAHSRIDRPSNEEQGP